MRMIERNSLPILCVLLYAAWTPHFAYAQNAEANQRIAWKAVPYVSHYEIILEKEEFSNWVLQFHEICEDKTYIDCHLAAGNYRFKVQSFDILGRPGDTTDWIPFNVDESKKKAAPVRAGAPDTLKNDYSEEIIASMWRLEALCVPLITLPTGVFNQIYENAVFQPIGFALRFSVLPLKTAIGNFGIEVMPSWNFFTHEYYNKMRYTHIAGGNTGLLWQKLFLSNAALNFRLGGGVSYFASHFEFNEGEDLVEQNALNPSLYAGVSLQSFISRSMYFEIGAEYYQFIAKDDPMLSYIRAILGLGWWF